MTAIKEEAIEVEASKITTCSKSVKNSSQDDKGNQKQPKSKSKKAAHGSQDDQQTEVVDLTPDDLDSAFSALMNKCSQESTKSQQEVSKPASLDVNKSSQDSDKSHGDESLQPDRSVSPGRSPSREHHQSGSHHQSDSHNKDGHRSPHRSQRSNSHSKW